MVTVYGLSSCDTCRKVRRWLSAHGFEHHFHDVRRDGLDPGRLDEWLVDVGWETIVNRRSTTWRGLDARDRENLDAARAKSLLMANPALLKRPVIDTDGQVIVGFDPSRLTALLEGVDD